MNWLIRLLTLSKIRRAIRAIKYILIAIKIYNQEIAPIINNYISNVYTFIKELREMELLNYDSNFKKK